jgi:hypothetical protein
LMFGGSPKWKKGDGAKINSALRAKDDFFFLIQ